MCRLAASDGLLVLRLWSIRDSVRLLLLRPRASKPRFLSTSIFSRSRRCSGGRERMPRLAAAPARGMERAQGMPFRHHCYSLHTSQTSYVCQNCGESFLVRHLACPSCKQQNALKRFTESKSSPSEKVLECLSPYIDSGPHRVSDIMKGKKGQGSQRIQIPGDTGVEFSRVLGGGLIPGSLILVGGDPGIGKSTLILQVAGLLADKDCQPVLYVSGEESMEQVGNRAKRIKLSCENLYIYSASNLEDILCVIGKLSPSTVIIDSIQSLYLASEAGGAGGPKQVRMCAQSLVELARIREVSILLIGHVTKAGEIAGPRFLEHIVDVVLYLEGESLTSCRLLRVAKNRFGSTNEIGVFEMVEGALVAVANPSEFFLSKRSNDSATIASTAVAAIMEGSRSFLIEIQALCSVRLQHARRLVNLVDSSRLSVILAVLETIFKQKRGSECSELLVLLKSQDLFINVVGGMEVQEPAADLAIAVAILSSCLDKVVPADMVFVGEVGLSGELRQVRNLDKRIIECVKLGFKKCVVPMAGIKSVNHLENDIEIIPCSNIKDIPNIILLPTPPLVRRIECD